MAKTHDFDSAWKTILEAFEQEIVEVMFSELYPNIDWEAGIQSLEQELVEIQKEIFDKDSAEKIISDKIIKVKLKNRESKILFIHVEVQSSSNKDNVFGERMFRYFYRIWDRFRYKEKDNSEIVGAAIYTYSGTRGKDKSYVYKLPELEEEIIRYNFRTIDVESISLDEISENNPIKLVFKIAKELLETETTDEAIYEAKVRLAKELSAYDKVKSEEQKKALVYLLEYLFLIEDPKLEKEYEEFRQSMGGVLKMTIDEIREKHLILKGKEEGKEEGELKKTIEIAKNLLDLLDDNTIAIKTGLSLEEVRKLRA